MNRFLAALVLLASSAALSAQSPTPKFEAADVHRNDEQQIIGAPGALYGDRYIVRQTTLASLIGNAYSLDTTNVQGGPPWLELYRYDVIAKTAANTPPATVKLMLQALLADRFGVVVHPGSAPMPAYVLTAKDAKSKLKPSSGGDAACDPGPPPSGPSPKIVLKCHGKTMDQLASDLRDFAGGYLDKPVVNNTGLTGEWDYDLIWTPKGALASSGADGISIFDAVDKGLGLKLELQTAPRPVLIVDKAQDKPTPNSPDLAKLMPPLPAPTFDVAVIKESKPGQDQMSGNITKDQVKLQNLPLRFMIAIAWNFNPDDSDRIVGPKWLDSAHFDILAKIGADTATQKGSNGLPVDSQDLIKMLQALIAERFQMKFHLEDRTLPAYTLTAVSPKLKPAADPNARTRCTEGPGPEAQQPGYKDPRTVNPVLNRLMYCQNMTMPQVARKFQEIAGGYIHSDVVDNTGLKGSYDFTLSFSSAGQGAGGGAAPPGGDASDPNGALTLFDAVSRQLGLKLAKEKRPIPVLVIDSINEKPSEN
jgi:uncharacterized protein (TIGR03435 family)